MAFSLRTACAAAALFASAPPGASAFAPPRPTSSRLTLPSSPAPSAALSFVAASPDARSRLLQSAVALEDTATVVGERNEQQQVVAPPSSGGTEESGLRRRLRRFRRRLSIGAAVSSTSNRIMLREHAFAIVAGLCLSFNSGYINGACLSGLLTGGEGVGVSAFTGAYSKAGLALGAGQLGAFAFNVRMILSFMAGACLSGMINPRPVTRRLGPTYGPTFLVGSALLAASSVLSNLRPSGMALFYFAAAANGLQNGMSSMYSANLIRTSHMSGISTDIGVIAGQILRGNRESAWKFLVLSGLASSFLTGSAASYFAVTKCRSLALAFNAAFFLAIGAGCIAFTAKERRVSLWQAASGRWEWKSDKPPTGRFLSELFERADADGNGYIDREQLGGLLKDAGMIVSDVGVGVIFRSADTNGDGVISREEVFALITCDDDEQCTLEDKGP